MTHTQALQRLRQCRENQPNEMQVLVAGEIVDALLLTSEEAMKALAKARAVWDAA